MAEEGYKVIREKDVEMIQRILASAPTVPVTTVATSEEERATLTRVAEAKRPLPGDKPPTVTDSASATAGSGFVFGEASKKELIGVNVDLQRVCNLALRYSTQDFCVFDGIRSYKEQADHVRNGTSQTMQSKHLQGLAVDLVPWVNGGPVWDWEKIYPIAQAVDRAATELGVANRITWGGAWDRKLSDFGGDSSAYKREAEKYCERHPGKDFIDGPHFEILPK